MNLAEEPAILRNVHTFVADGEHTAAANRDLPVGMLSEWQHLCTLPFQSTMFCALRLVCIYSLPLLFRQILVGKPNASSCRQLQLKGSFSQPFKTATDAISIIYCCGTCCHKPCDWQHGAARVVAAIFAANCTAQACESG